MKIIKLLDCLSEKLENKQNLASKYTVSNGTNNGFEKLVPEVLDTLKDELEFSYNIFYGHHFPDLEIVIGNEKYGLELKSRKKSQWTTNGNSVFESITDEDYSEIYLLFGSLNNDESAYQVQYKPYWEVTTGIAVTHSPRFKIDMRAEITDSVFKDSDEYFKLREMTEPERIAFLQEYLKRSTDKAKWYIPQETESVKPIQFKDLTEEVRNQVLAETFVLFPHDLIKRYPSGTFRGEYGRSTEYLLGEYFYFTPSLRDSYSAGGSFEYNSTIFPKVIEKLLSLKENIEYILDNASHDFQELAYDTWEELGVDLDRSIFRKNYYLVLDRIGQSHLKDELQEANLNSLSALYQLY